MYGFLFGFFYFLAGFYWIGHALVVYNPAVGVLGYGASILVAIVGAFYVACPFWLCSCFSKNHERALSFVIFWALFEYARGVWITNFPWNIIGYAWMNNRYLCLLPSILTVYGSGALLMLCVMCIYLSYTERSWRWASVSIVILVIGLILGKILTYGFSSDTSVLNVRLVQGNISERDKTFKNFIHIYEKYLFLTQVQRPSKIKLIIWPETAVLTSITNHLSLRMGIASVVPKNGYLITGSIEPLDDEITNSLIVLNDEGNIVARYNKMHLVPFGEYMPWHAFLDKLFPSYRGFVSGKEHMIIKFSGLPSFAPLICYESIFPYYFSSIVPDLFINITNDAWYGHSTEKSQHFFQAGVRAIEDGIPLVRVSNQGLSGVFYPNGMYQAYAPSKKGFIDLAVLMLKKNTIYQHVHSLIFWLFLFSIAGAIGIMRWKNRASY